MSFRPSWYGRAIGRNHACMRPSRFVFVSVDAKKRDISGKKPYTQHELDNGHAISVHWKKGRKPKESSFDFKTQEEFWQHIGEMPREKSVLWIVSFDALYTFTLLGLWSEIEVKHYAVDRAAKSYHDPRTGKVVTSGTWRGLLAIDGRPFHIETMHEKGRVNFTDLMNYYNCELKDIERMVYGANYTENSSTGELGELSSPCVERTRTIKSGYLGLVSQWESEDNGNWKLSAAGLAWSNYRHKHYPAEIVSHRHAEARDLEWASYFGGECRCYYRGATPTGVVNYDVNSLYPYVMAEHEYPTELVDYILNPKPGIVEHLLDRFAVIADVTLEATTDDYPVKHGRRTVYPIGLFRTCLTGVELSRARDRGHIVTVHRIAYYLRANLFSSYVGFWYGRKRESSSCGDCATERFCKMMLNSLQGKFAQRTPVWETDPRIDVVRPWKCFPWNDPETKALWNARSIGWLGQRIVARSDKQHAFPAISAYICAYARDYMRSIRNSLPPSVVYYQDTDSLHIDSAYVDAVGSDPVPISADLGGFRKVATYSGVTYRGPKNYSTDTKRVIAGIKESDLCVGQAHYVGARIERTSAVVSREPDCTVREYQTHIDCPGSCGEGSYGDDGWSRPLVISQI